MDSTQYAKSDEEAAQRYAKYKNVDPWQRRGGDIAPAVSVMLWEAWRLLGNATDACEHGWWVP